MSNSKHWKQKEQEENKTLGQQQIMIPTLHAKPRSLAKNIYVFWR
jgi:hypothetical protein